MDNTLKSKYQHVIAIFQKDLDIITDILLFCCPITDEPLWQETQDGVLTENVVRKKGTNLRLP